MIQRDPDIDVLPDSLNLAFIESLYAKYLHDPSGVSPSWRRYFQKLGDGAAGRVRLGPSFRPASVFNPARRADAVTGAREIEMALLQDRVDQLVRPSEAQAEPFVLELHIVPAEVGHPVRRVGR